MPLAKQSDNNVGTLLEILKKFKKSNGKPPTANKKGKNAAAAKNEFMPYNKSIMTRVIAQQLQKKNLLCVSHFSKASVLKHFKEGSGPAKSLFLQIEDLYG